MQTVNSAYSLLENSGGWKVSHLISQGHSYFDTTTMNKQVNNIKTGKKGKKRKIQEKQQKTPVIVMKLLE